LFWISLRISLTWCLPQRDGGFVLAFTQYTHLFPEYCNLWLRLILDYEWPLPLEHDLSDSIPLVFCRLVWSPCIPSAHCWCLCCLSRFAHSCCSSISRSRTPHSSLKNIPNAVGPCCLSWWMLICGDVEEAAICPKPRRSDILVIARCVKRNEYDNDRGCGNLVEF
jgi:hypothetical protein